MCFNIYGGGRKSPIRADKDIIVFKVIKRNGYGIYRNLCINGKYEKWVEGNIYYETTPFASAEISKYPTLNRTYDIEVNGDAFHSCKTRAMARNHNDGGNKVVEMIIPKGSTYYENDGEYVSSAIYYPKREARVAGKRGRGRPRKS